jgi:hypothetical protein
MKYALLIYQDEEFVLAWALPSEVVEVRPMVEYDGAAE